MVLKEILIIATILFEINCRSIPVRDSPSNETIWTEHFDEPINKSVTKMGPKALDCQTILKSRLEQIKKEPEEYKKMIRLLQPIMLSRREISIKDLITVLFDIFYMNLSYEAKLKLDINNAAVDENLRTDYRSLIKLIEEEVMDNIVPIKFIEVFSSKKNLLRINVSEKFVKDYLDEMEKMGRKDFNQTIYSIMALPKAYSNKMGYSIDDFMKIIEMLILNSKIEKENDIKKSYQRIFDNFVNLLKQDPDKDKFPSKSWCSLMKTILSEVPEDLRSEIFSTTTWKNNIDVKVLDLFKNLNIMYHINLYSLYNFDKYIDPFFEEYSRCIRCQRIVLEAILKSLEKFLKPFFRGRVHDEL